MSRAELIVFATACLCIGWVAGQLIGRACERSLARPRRGVDRAEDCQRCGRGNTLWWAPSPLWNAVMRGGSIDGSPLYSDLVCATCFMEIAEEKGIADGFKVFAERVHVELETITPSGRVWDEDRQLWKTGEEKE